MPDLEWDECETVKLSSGEIVIRRAVHCRRGVQFEMSMHDLNIKRLVPEKDWIAVTSSQVPNSRMHPTERGITVLIGLGKPLDASGNVRFVQVLAYPPFCANTLMEMIKLLIRVLTELGIKLRDNNIIRDLSSQ